MQLDSKKSEVNVWLVKFPSFLAQHILSTDSELHIGDLQIYNPTPNTEAQVSLLLSESLSSAGLPKEYNLTFSEMKRGCYVVQEDSNHHRIEGIVNKELFVTPCLNEEYISFRKQRGAEGAPKRGIQVIDYLREGKRGERFGSVGELESLARKRKKMLMEKKRERLGRGEVMDMLFKAFEKHEAWTVKDLADFSGQPVAYVQELVGEICVLNKKDHRNTYELKPEYAYKD